MIVANEQVKEKFLRFNHEFSVVLKLARRQFAILLRLSNDESFPQFFPQPCALFLKAFSA